MNALPYLLLSIGFTSLLFVAACEDESKKNNAAILGRWELERGFRNKKETETLAGTYFSFNDDGQMVTNLPIGPEEPMPYQVVKNEIRTKGQQRIKYLLEGVTDSTLLLSFELRSVQFELHFRRAAEVTAPDPMLQPIEQDTLQITVDTTQE